MDYIKLLGVILNIGAAMIRCGAETYRAEDSLYRICAAYGFTECNLWVIPSNIQACVCTPEGEVLTQIRHIRSTGSNFDQLDSLNALSRKICADTPGPEELSQLLQEILNKKPLPFWTAYPAAAVTGARFSVFFSCDWLDAITAACASLLIIWLENRLNRRESNPLVFNFIITAITEVFIITAVRFGFGHHVGYISVGVVMLLISAMGTTIGINDLAHMHILSGLLNIIKSLNGAVGIALGVALPLILLKDIGSNEIMSINPNNFITLTACTLACFGFAILYNLKGRKAYMCALGAFITWLGYIIAFKLYPNSFAATLFASAICAVFAQIMARVIKTPSSIFMTISVFPVIPGATLYYMMYGLVTANRDFALAKALELVLTCAAIVLGFMVVEVIYKYILKRIKRKRPQV